MNAAASLSAPALGLRKTLQPDHSSGYRCSHGDFMEMTAEQLVARIAAAFDVTAPPSDGAVIDNLIKSGVGDRQADVAVKLVQIACGRIFLDGLGIKFSDDYLCFDAHGKVVESGRLSQHPVFAAAMERMNSAPLAVKYLAVMSADVQTVNKMMQKGSDPSSLATGPSALFVEVPTEAGLATARQMISETLKTSHKAPPRA
jgi:hypothetical protein